jgi:hypothetical protein
VVSSQTDVGERTRSTITEDEATRAFSLSVVVSGIRCLLTYILFPWVLPAIGIASGVGPGIGLVVGTVAIGFNVASIRRFWIPDHRWKWPITVLNTGVIILLVVLIANDLRDLFG